MPVMMLRATLFGVIALACGCSEPKPPAVSPVPVAKPAATNPTAADQSAVTTEATEKVVAGVTISIPAGWEERQATFPIQAEYQLHADSGPGRLTMSSTGGGVEANLARWQTQFTRGRDDPAPAQTTVIVDGQEAIVLELSGTFRDGFSQDPPKPGWSLVGAAIPTGPATFFVKLTGPRETVQAHREAFLELVKTARLPR
jgi:hypothetical protein